MRPQDIPGPGPHLPDAGTPLTHHPSWPGWIEIVYTCGHIYALRLTDDLPSRCPDRAHVPPPVQSPAPIT